MMLSELTAFTTSIGTRINDESRDAETYKRLADEASDLAKKSGNPRERTYFEKMANTLRMISQQESEHHDRLVKMYADAAAMEAGQHEKEVLR